MKLDRNINADGRGKYALINLRTNQVQWGNEPGEQFFVIKYKDKFSAAALAGYAKAVWDEAERLHREGHLGMASEMVEWYGQIMAEVAQAESSTDKRIPS